MPKVVENYIGNMRWAGGSEKTPWPKPRLAKYNKIKKKLVGASGQEIDLIANATGVATSGTYEGLRCAINVSGTGYLYRVEVTGDVVYRNLNKKTKVEMVAGTEKILSLPAQHIFNATDARAYASQEARKLKYGDFSYSWASKDNVEIGSFVNLQTVNPAINTVVQILEKSKAKHTPLYQYRGIGTAEFSLETVILKGDTYFTPSQLAFFTDKSIRGNVVTIAASDYYYPANYRCDGTADEVQINNAITALSDNEGGGVVKLSPGTFYIADAIELDDNIALEGAGAKTVIDRDAFDYSIKCIGTSDTYKESVVVKDLKLTRTDSEPNDAIKFEYVDDAKVNGVIINGYYQGVLFENCSDGGFISNIMIDCSSWGVTFDYSGGIIMNNFLYHTELITARYGIYIEDGQNTIVSSNSIYNFQIIGKDAYAGVGIYVYNNETVISNNLIHDNYSRKGTFYPIQINSADHVSITNNSIRNNYTYKDSDSSAIKIESGADYNEIKNNKCRNNGNLIDRGNCESTTAPMVADETTPDNTNVGTYERSSTQEYEGTYSYKATGDGGGSMLIRLVNTDSDNHGLIEGLTYKLSAYVYVPTGGYTVGNVKLFYDDDQTSTIYSSAVSAVDTWELLTLEFTVDADSTDLDFGLSIAETGTDSVYWDNIRLQPVGVHNEHDQQFVDNGTGTQQNANSWQDAFPA